MEENRANPPSVIVYECATDASSRMPEAPARVMRIPVPCAGKLQPEHLLKAVESGADIVVVLTCSEGECRYLEGRQRIERRVDYIRGLLDEIGLERERLILLDRDGDEQLAAVLRREVTPSPLARRS